MSPSPPERPASRSHARTGFGLAIAVAVVAVSAGAWLARDRVRRVTDTTLAPALAALAGTAPAVSGRRKPNRLVHEKSPYLLQHAYNPVDWYAWGEEAFATARRENKPIFLSIGYSTCHWCHVMERESFEDDSVAALLNAYFVAIKVDREERPDVDRVYMTSMQAMGLGGGWPLNCFLTPAGEPFYGGTYFPPRSRQGRPGLIEVLPHIHEAWGRDHERLVHTAGRVFGAIIEADRAGAADGQDADAGTLLAHARDTLARIADHDFGGFGGAPKFPQVVNLNFLQRAFAHDPEHRAAASALALRQLDAMRAGGIHDHLGGGFHRYSTDREWLVPHFEKMLYDQAELASAYLDAYQITGRAEYAETARDVFDYVARDLTAPSGAFLSAEDADSEGEEGKFYVWTPVELDLVLGADDGALVAARYGVTATGNFEHGTSILSEAMSTAALAQRFGASEPTIVQRLAHARVRLLEARDRRPRPHRDDKVLAAWNGLMISAFARGARVLDDASLLARARRAAEFVWTTLRDPRTGEMRRREREGDVAGHGQLDDYAYVALGFTDLYRASLEPVWLERAAAVTEAQIARFWDEDGGGFFDSPAGDPHLPLRLKDDFDGAEMSGASVATENLLVLAALLDRPAWRDLADRTLALYARKLAPAPIAMPQMLVAFQLARTTPRHVVIAGRRDADDTRALFHAFNRRFLPDDVLLFKDLGTDGARLAALVPFTVALSPQGDAATAFVCVDGACRLPTTSLTEFEAQLDEPAATRLAHRDLP
jgi:uncharacterized protein YyaL (SSP411 family)